MKTKFVQVRRNVLIFSEACSVMHSTASNIAFGPVLSAGFCDAIEKDDLFEVKTYGESVSLRTKSNPEVDSDVINDIIDEGGFSLYFIEENSSIDLFNNLWVLTDLKETSVDWKEHCKRYLCDESAEMKCVAKLTPETKDMIMKVIFPQNSTEFREGVRQAMSEN